MEKWLVIERTERLYSAAKPHLNESKVASLCNVVYLLNSVVQQRVWFVFLVPIGSKITLVNSKTFNYNKRHPSPSPILSSFFSLPISKREHK